MDIILFIIIVIIMCYLIYKFCLYLFKTGPNENDYEFIEDI